MYYLPLSYLSRTTDNIFPECCLQGLFLLFFFQVQVGDIVKVVNGQFFPADLILLSSR